MNSAHAAVTITLFTAAALAQQELVVPQAYASADANAFLRLPGAKTDLHQQTIIAGSHLAAMSGHLLTSIAFRRTAANEQFAGGTCNWTVVLAPASHDPLASSSTFANNLGVGATPVFQGQVSIPLSPINTGPNVAWTASTMVEAVFQTPFLYSGGDLCVDIVGTTVAGQEASWWMADAVFEDVSGSSVRVGTGCGAYGGATGAWSNVEERSLVCGGEARFSANGTPGNVVLMILGTTAAAPGTPLTALGLPAAIGCNTYIALPDVLTAMVAIIGAPLPQFASQGGDAQATLPLPNRSWMLNQTLASQWMDLVQQFATSDAILWTTAPVAPTLQATVIEGPANSASGRLIPNMAHVIRFTHQAP